MVLFFSLSLSLCLSDTHAIWMCECMNEIRSNHLLAIWPQVMIIPSKGIFNYLFYLSNPLIPWIKWWNPFECVIYLFCRHWNTLHSLICIVHRTSSIIDQFHIQTFSTPHCKFWNEHLLKCYLIMKLFCLFQTLLTMLRREICSLFVAFFPLNYFCVFYFFFFFSFNFFYICHCFRFLFFFCHLFADWIFCCG